MIQVPLQRAPPRTCQPVFSFRQPSVKRFRTDDVICLLQLPCVDAKIPIRRFKEILQLVERQRTIHRQRAYNPQADPFVNQPVQIRRHRFARASAHRAQRRRFLSLRLFLSCCRASCHNSPLSAESPRDPCSKSDLNSAESTCHQRVTPLCRREQRHCAQNHQTQTHHRYNANGKCATSDDCCAVQKQPCSRQRRVQSGVRQRICQQPTSYNRRRKT